MKAKFIYSLLLAFYFAITLHGQVIFQNTYGGPLDDYCYSVIQSTDGGYVMTGASQTPTNGFDVYFAKTDGYGNLLWSKTFGGSLDDVGFECKQTNDGGYIITGSTMSFGQGKEDVYLIKTGTDGNLLWSKTFGKSSNERGNSVVQTSDGGYAIAGGTSVYSYNASQYYLVRTDTSGSLLWTSSFQCGFGEGYSILEIPSGGFVFTGRNDYTGYSALTLIKVDTNGTPIWGSRTMPYFGGSSCGYSLFQDGSGYSIVGDGGINADNVYITRTGLNGLAISTYTISNTRAGYGIIPITGGFVIAGRALNSGGTEWNILLTKQASSPWSKTYGGTKDEGVPVLSGNRKSVSLQKTLDGGFIIGSNTLSFGAGGSDIYLIKTDQNGNSGCNEINQTSISGSLTPNTGNVSILPTSVGGIAANSATAIGTMGNQINICTSTTDLLDEDITSEVFSISPNPTKGFCTISTTIPSGVVCIYNVLGEKVYSGNLHNPVVDISLNPNGTYFVQITSSDGRSAVRKITKE